MPGLARRLTINAPAKRRSLTTEVADPRDRFDGGDRPQSKDPPPLFPITSRGYDRAIVDRRVAELEQELVELDRELANLHASTPLRSEAAEELERIGEQVSAILIAAQESAEETRCLAAAEAERRIADAENRVRSLNEEANRDRRGLQNEIACLRRDRDRLREDIRSIADRLRAVADNPAIDLPAGPVDETLRTAEP